MWITLLETVLLIQIRVVHLIYQSNNKTKKHDNFKLSTQHRR
jgi:hypothetical protein